MHEWKYIMKALKKGYPQCTQESQYQGITRYAVEKAHSWGGPIGLSHLLTLSSYYLITKSAFT